MKTLITTDTTVAGVWHHTLDLANYLLEEHVKVVMVAMGPPLSKAQESKIKGLKKLGLAFYHENFKLEWMDDPWQDVEKAGVWIKSIYEKEKPDLMHFNNYGQVGIGWEVPTVLVAHSCVASWWHTVKKESLPEKYGNYFETVKHAMQKAEVLVSPTHAQLDLYKKLYGNHRNSKVIYNGIPDVPDLNGNKLPILFSLGDLSDEGKNIDLILRAAHKISGEIFIAGSDPKKMACPKNITFVGELSRTQVFNWLKISSGFVLPARYEPFGLSFLEAAAHRTALIGGDIPSLREVWGESMTYIDPKNINSLANACNNLLMNKEYCIIEGDKAFNRSKLYSLQRMGEEYMELYDKIAIGAEIST